MAVAAFKSDREALEFLYGGPAEDPQLDIAPEAPEQLPVNAVETPLPGAIEPNVQAVLDANGEPPLPPFVQGEEEPLPPVVPPEAPAFATDEEAMAFLRAAEPPSPQPEPTPAFASDEEALTFLRSADANGERPEAKPLNLSFGGQEAALAQAVMGDDKPVEKPVTTPEAADGTDVTFEKDGPAFKFTGTLVMEPETGPMAGLDGMRAVPPQGPVANAMDPAAIEPALNQRPRLVPSAGGQIVFDQSSPERFTQGVEEAYASGILPQSNYEKIKASSAQIFKVVEERRKLEEKAQADPKLLAILQGLGRGGAMTVGAIGSAKLVGPAAAAVTAMTPAAPLAPAVGVVAGTGAAIVGGIAAGVGYDALYKQLGKHFEEYDNVMKAAELYPMHRAGGEMGMLALSLPVSVAQGARGLINTAQGPGGLPAAARQAGAALGLGAGTGVVAYPIDAAVRGEEITPGGLATAAATGALMGGFFINNRLARTPEVARVFDKVQRGQKLTAAEETLFRSASGPIESAVRRGQMDGQRMTDIQVEVPQTSVMGMMPAAGRARVEATFFAPPRLPEGAVRAAQNFAASRPRPAGPAPAAAAETAPAVPREAPVNIIPPGETIIPPPPMTPAMMTPDAFADAMATERGLDMDFNPEATTELFAEHFRVVRDAVNNNQPVSSAALDLYEMRVPYYVRDEETGLAVFDQPSFDAWQRYVSGQGEEFKSDAREAGAVELLDAVIDLGGLPSRQAGDRRGAWSGELESLLQTAQGAGRGKGSDNEKGVFLNKLFRKDAKDVDDLVQGLQQRGFRVETPADLLELLDNRLRSGREIFGYPVVADEMPRSGRRPRGAVPGAPRQGELLGEADVEFTLTGQTDRTSLTPEEMAMAQRAADERERANALQGSLFGEAEGPVSTDPLPARGGGTAKVPPGQPVGMGALRPPDWVLQPGETSEGRRLIKGIQNFRPGQKWSFGHIVGMLNKAVQLEMRRSTSQTTRRHPAHYLPINKVAFTSNTQDQINFHEAGHQLQYMLQDRVPDIWNAHEAELVALTERPDSMASQPPAGASDIQKRNYILGEGVAEWLRLLMVDPAVVQNMAVSKTISAAADRFYPGMSKQIRDAVRAMNAFKFSTTDTKIDMVNNMPVKDVSASEIIAWIERGKAGVGDLVASGAPIDRLRNRIIEAIMKDRKETGMTLKQALAAVNRVAKKMNQAVNAYNMVLSIDQEVQLAFSGEGPAKGLRAMGPDGNFVYFTKWTWNELRDRVPRQHRKLFDRGAWALESYERYVRNNNDYPGMREGITPEDLLATVRKAKDTIPGFGQLFAEQSNFLNSVLEIREFGGILSKEERERIQYKRPTYWPLPRQIVQSKAYGGKSGATINKGVRRAFGSGEPTKPVDEAALDAINELMSSYYWNRFFLVSKDRATEVTKMKSLPWEARQLAGAFAVKLKVPQRKVATLNEKEKAQIKDDVMEALAVEMEKIIGFKPEIDPETVRVAWSFKDLYRPTKPGDVRVLSVFENGERVYYQVGDPAVFNMFAEGSNIKAPVKFLKWLFGPASANMQRLITQQPTFSIPGNLARDIMSQLFMNPNNEVMDWIPGYTHMVGAWNKFTKKYPQVFNEGLLLSRNQPTDSELLYRAQHSQLWTFLTQSFYVSEAKDPVVRLLATVLNPSNLMSPAWIIGDLANAIAPGAAVGGLIGGPVGAAVGAVVGPAVGFTGKNIGAFVEETGREGAAVRELQRGMTDEEALKQYWLRSGQFNERPGVASVAQLLKIIPFANPSLQATRNAIQALADPDPRRRFTAWSRIAFIMGLSAAGAIIKYLMMTPEERRKERERTLEDRMGFMDIGGIRVPYAYGPEGALQSLTSNMIMDDLLDRKSDGEKQARMALFRIFDPQGLFNPFGPQVTAWQETKANWSYFRQRNIVSPWMANLEPSLQYYSTTPAFYREVGKMFNWSPIKLQYFVQQAIGRQIDDTIRLVESIGGGKPIQEAADVPFVGRMFVRDPIGFASQSVQDAGDVEDKLRTLNLRLNAKGWGTLGRFDRNGNPETSAEGLSPDLQRLQMQLEYLQGLRSELRTIGDLQAVAKYYGLRGDYANERNVRAFMTLRAQAALAGNKDGLRVMDQASALLERIAPAPPEQQAADYLQRRF